MSHNDLISDFSKKDRRTLRRLSKAKPVRADLITGLVDRAGSIFYRSHPDAVPVEWSNPTTSINDQDLPGDLAPLVKTVKVIDELTGSRRVVVNIGTRKAGTRVPIFTHEAGAGLVVPIGGKGLLTTWTEGLPVGRVSKGDFFYTPTNIPVSAANISDYGIRFLDISVVPVGVSLSTDLEPS
jgi:uncharacterized RmlC-like cupin family protein